MIIVAGVWTRHVAGKGASEIVTEQRDSRPEYQQVVGAGRQAGKKMSSMFLSFFSDKIWGHFVFTSSFFSCLWKRTKKIYLKVMDSSESCHNIHLKVWYFIYFKCMFCINNIINIVFNI